MATSTKEATATGAAVTTTVTSSVATAAAPDEPGAAAAESGGGPRFFFVRHGEGEHNALIDAGKAEGDAAKTEAGRNVLDPRLTARGREQAAGLRAKLQAEGAGAFELVVTSPLSRALETAQIAFGDLGARLRRRRRRRRRARARVVWLFLSLSVSLALSLGL